MLKWARENGCEWDATVCSRAAEGGHFEVLKWARKNGCEWDREVYTSAAAGGFLRIIKWAKENGCPGWGEDLIQEINLAASQHQKHAIINWVCCLYFNMPTKMPKIRKRG